MVDAILEGQVEGANEPRRTRRAGGGRKPALNAAELQVLRELVEANGRQTLVELAAALAERTGKSLSKRTLGSCMQLLGFHKVKPQKAPGRPAAQSTPRYAPQHRREPTATAYPSTLTDREWAAIEPLFAKTEKRGAASEHGKRLMMDAVFYQLRTGNQWRYLPKDFPPWTAVWTFFRRLRNSGQLDRMLDALHATYRQAAGRAEEPTAGIVDSQTVKTTEKGGPAATTRARKPRGANGIWLSTPSEFHAQS